MFDALRELIEFKGEDDWKAFKKWAKANEQSFSSWHFARNGTRMWNIWWNKQEAEERARLEKKFSYKRKKYHCTVCGKSKSEEKFHSFERMEVSGLRACVYVRTGNGKCKDCFEGERAERKRASEEHRKELRARWYQDHKSEVSEKQRKRRHSDAEKDKAWKASHKEQINQHIRERKQADPVYKLKCQARTMIYQSFARTGNVKQERCESIVGLTIDNFIDYLRGTYEKTYGKEWDGVEAVHIDHIIPLATAQSEEDVKRLCHYSNLQLLTAQDNLKKGSKV